MRGNAVRAHLVAGVGLVLSLAAWSHTARADNCAMVDEELGPLLLGWAEEEESDHDFVVEAEGIFDDYDADPYPAEPDAYFLCHKLPARFAGCYRGYAEHAVKALALAEGFKEESDREYAKTWFLGTRIFPPLPPKSRAEAEEAVNERQADLQESVAELAKNRKDRPDEVPVTIHDVQRATAELDFAQCALEIVSN